jgi:protein O-GlcNAc transferase
MNQIPPSVHEPLQCADAAVSGQVVLTLAQAMQRATEAYNRGDWSDAEHVCRSILQNQADQFDALTLLGMIAAQTHREAEAAHHLAHAVAVDPDNPWAHNNLGGLLGENDRLDDALKSYTKALELKPDYADAHCNRGIALHKLERFAEAVDSYELALRFGRDDASIYYNRGVALQALRRHAAAAESYQQALRIRPDLAEAHSNLGDSLAEAGRLHDSLDCYERALQLEPGRAAVHFNRGVALQELERFEEALQSYGDALRLKPDYAKAYTNCGNVLLSLERFSDALASYERAVQLAPDLVEAHVNRGIALQELQRFDEALGCHEFALKIKPDCAEAHYNRGRALHAGNRPIEALHCFEQALRVKADYAEAHESCAHALRDLQRHEAAIAAYDRALSLNPELKFVLGLRQHVRMRICDWHDFDAVVEQIRAGIECDEAVSPPFPVLALADSAALHRRAAAIWVQQRWSRRCSPPDIPRRAKHQKIHVAYFSADFRDHPVSTLTAELFEIHDRSKIELFAFSLGPETQDATRRRIQAAVGHFIDVRDRADQDIVALCRRMEIDIAVDLGGLTGDGRLARTFALRPAPLQVSYLGYLGSMGTASVDYLIADATIIPEPNARHYSEKIIYLPSYQVNDSRRPISSRQYTRQELGLPPGGFVYCCFNANYKITPETFGSWMRILKTVDGSVLLLSADSRTGMANLKREAERRGVDAARLVFGDRLPMPEYLARYRVADLFLDTLPYNAGTTASDALWSGLPVLTLIGEAFPGRVAASLLMAMALPELIATTREQYERLAVELAADPGRLGDLKQALAHNRRTAPLFDTRSFANCLERAYSQIYARYLADSPPENIFVGSEA